MKLILPMAGKASRFNQDSDKLVIKPLLDVKGKKLYQWALSSFNKLPEEVIFIIQNSHQELTEELTRHYPTSTVVKINQETRGPGETLSLADSLLDQSPVLVCDCDLYFRSSALQTFLSSPDPEIKVGLLTFQSNKPHYSYVQETNGRITDIVEKKVISTSAVCGCYYFSSGTLLNELIEKTIKRINDREVFLSDIIKTALMTDLSARAFPCDKHVSLGTPGELQENASLLPFEK